MSSKSKKKGYANEIVIRNLLKKEGIPVERVPLSGSMGGKYSGDLVIPSIDNPDFVCEVKIRKGANGFRTIEKWIEGKDLLFIRRDRKDPLVVMPYEAFVQILRKYYERVY